MRGDTYKDIAARYGVPVTTVAYWRRKGGWKRQRKPKGGPPYGSHNARGNRGGKGGPRGNKFALKHGLFRRILPDDVRALAEEISHMDPLDILWQSICLKFAAILRAQSIMYVKDKDDVTKRVSMNGAAGTGYQWTEAYEKQAAFLTAQSKAMTTLMGLIKQYEELCERGLATEEQKLRIEALKQKIQQPDDMDSGPVIIRGEEDICE